SKRCASYKEDVLFTHFGLSGPAVLNVSHQAVVAHERAPGRVSIGIRLDGERSPQAWEQLLDERIAAAPRKALKDRCDEWVPVSVAAVLLAESGIDGDRQAGHTPRTQRRTLARLLYELRLTVKRSRPIEQAMVTAGGVDVREVNPKSMESKMRPGLYFAGEIL